MNEKELKQMMQEILKQNNMNIPKKDQKQMMQAIDKMTDNDISTIFGNNFTEEEKNRFQKEMDSDDLLEKAYDANTDKMAIKYAKQALELNPDNIDAERFLNEFEDDLIIKTQKDYKVMEKAKKLLEQDEEMNYFEKENIGHFYGIMETRPYMRAIHTYILDLMMLGRNSEAIKQAEQALTLCKSDNLGIRYLLIKLYALLEKFEDAESLYKKYKSESVEFLFPLSIMYYKKGDYINSKKIIEKSISSNKYLKKYLLIEDIEELMDAIMNGEECSRYIEYGSEQEIIQVFQNMTSLLVTVPEYLIFCNKVISTKK